MIQKKILLYNKKTIILLIKIKNVNPAHLDSPYNSYNNLKEKSKNKKNKFKTEILPYRDYKEIFNHSHSLLKIKKPPHLHLDNNFKYIKKILHKLIKDPVNTIKNISL